MYVVFGKRVQRSWASWCKVEFRDVVRRIFGVGGGSSVKRVGNLRASEVGVRSRFVLVVEGAVEDARGCSFEDLGSPPSSSPSESESSILSASSSRASSTGSSKAASASSIRLLFNCSTSTLTFSPSPSTSSQIRFLSIV